MSLLVDCSLEMLCGVESLTLGLLYFEIQVIISEMKEQSTYLKRLNWIPFYWSWGCMVGYFVTDCLGCIEYFAVGWL